MIPIINKRLHDNFGRTLDGRPIFRLVWSTEQTELRVGEFNVHYGSIYLRTEKGAKWVPKYPFAKDRWILEKLIQQPNPEILNSENGTYEPIFVFQDNMANPLPVVWRAVEYIMHNILFAPKSPKITEHDDIQGQEAEIDKDTQFFEDYINNKTPELALKLKQGSAVTVKETSND